MKVMDLIVELQRYDAHDEAMIVDADTGWLLVVQRVERESADRVAIKGEYHEIGNIEGGLRVRE